MDNNELEEFKKEMNEEKETWKKEWNSAKGSLLEELGLEEFSPTLNKIGNGAATGIGRFSAKLKNATDSAITATKKLSDKANESYQMTMNQIEEDKNAKRQFAASTEQEQPNDAQPNNIPSNNIASNDTPEYCSNCGSKIDAGAKFCSSCGSPCNSPLKELGTTVKAESSTIPVKQATQTAIKEKSENKRTEFAGKVFKCPNCGEPIKSFSPQCPICGYELRDVVASGVVKEFESELRRIEAGRRNDGEKGIKKLFSMAFQETTDYKIDQELANAITNFAIPNTREDIFEIMILAASNIDPIAHDTSGDGYTGAQREGKLMISTAWESKYNQAHQKAIMMFPDDSRLNEVENLYENKQSQIKVRMKREEEKEERRNRKETRGFIVWIVVMAVLVGTLYAMGQAESRKEEKLEKQLNATVTEIQEDVLAGDYDEALIKANNLKFDSGLDEDKAKQWEKEREYLIKMINEKKEGK